MADRPLLLGHRGARKYAPENTLAAFRLALDHGCDGFEFDVRLTADGKAVVCHDPKYKGIQVARCDFGEVREKCAEIPTLEEVLREFASIAFLNVELKVTSAEEVLIELLKKYPAEKGLVVSSFLPSVILRLRELRAEFPLGIICENRRQLARWKELPVHAVMVNSGLASQKVVDEIRKTAVKSKEGLIEAPEQRQIYVWTVNAAREMKKLADMGVDGIISDDTKLLAEELRRK